jgi:molecular chaperone DnaJ
MVNPYKILGVENGASTEDCRKAYKKLCRKYHPDNGGDSNMFDSVNKAWEQIQSGVVINVGIKRTSLRHETLFTFV